MLPDIRFAVRQLLKSPGFTAVAALTLALGIGVNSTMFSVLNTLIFRSAPFGDPSRLVDVFTTAPDLPFLIWSPGEAHDIRKESTVYDGFAATGSWNPSMAQPGEPAVRLDVMTVSEDFLPMLKVAPVMGRLFTPAENAAGDVAVLSNQFWQRRLGGDPRAIGRVLRLDGKSVTVVGIMPPALDDPLTWGRVDLWVPMAYDAKGWEIRNGAWLGVTARLKPGVTIAQAQAEMDILAARYAHDYPQYSAERGIGVVSLEQHRVDAVSRRMSWLVMDLSLFVLLIACVNLANLQMVRSAGQAREHAIRLALGSSRWRLVRQLLTESLILSLAGGALSLLVARWGNVVLGSRIQIDGVYGLELPLDLRVAGFAFLAAATTGAVFGVVPAWIASGADAGMALKQGGRGTTGDRSRHILRHVLIVSEVALALALLAGAGYFVKGTQRLLTRDFGFRPENRLVGNIDIVNKKYSGIAAHAQAFDELRSALGALPGVDGVALSTGNPAMRFWGLGDIAIEGRETPPAGKEPLTLFAQVTPGYFGIEGIRLLKGREFTEADREGTPKVAIINEAMARKFWPGENPIGKRLGMGERAKREPVEIVGVAADVTVPYFTFSPPETPFQTYTPLYQDDSSWITFTLRSSADPRPLEESVRAVVTRMDPDLAVYSMGSSEEKIGGWMADFELMGGILTVMAGLGLLLSSLGIYGVIASLAAQRTQEIGIRTALGAQSGDVLWLVMRNGLRLAALGTALGLALAFTLTFVLGRVMPEVPGRSAALTLGLSLLIVAVALVACWLPARRATKVDPIIALRGD
jgi:putative ABC transport system permease protein